MKKFVKVTLITSLICFVLGIIICMVVGLNQGFQFLHSDSNWWNGKSAEMFNTEDFDVSYTEEITALDVEFDFGELTVRTGDSFSVKGSDIVENTAKTSVENGTLKIRQNINNKNWFNFGPGNFTPNQRLEITVPEGTDFSDLKIKVGMVETDISNITAKRAEFDFGAGNTTLNNVVADKVIINGGVGNTDCKNVKFNDISMDVGVGEMTIEGEITGDCEIDTGVGNFDMEIDGDIDDYYFDVDAGVGDITIDGNHVRGKFGNRSAENVIDIDAGVGEIDISFKD